jgi:hypothetical protein
MLRDYDALRPGVFPPQGMYAYMAYLRHHGFPSPMLDWSKSYRIAAYFAFRHALHDGRVSIYVYSERPARIKVGSSRDPYIYNLGPYVKTHRRHFLQQSHYTMCMVFQDGDPLLIPHQRIFELSNRDQDLVWRFTMPATERAKVLTLFDEHNLNAFSLFGSEEALIETITFRDRAFR